MRSRASWPRPKRARPRVLLFRSPDQTLTEDPIHLATSGNPDLIELIRSEISRSGPISFARFVEQALYHPEHGFYSSGRGRLGRDGDFFTNVSVGPAFGQLLASQFIEIW